MKILLTAVTAFSLFAGSVAYAQPDRHDDRNNNKHPAMMMKGPAPAMHGGPSMMMMKGPADHGHADWRKGGHIQQTDWRRGQRVDYRSHHLARPQRGYEWRQVDGNFVLAAAATGLIASIIAANH